MFFFVKTELLDTPHTTVEINELMIVTTDEQVFCNVSYRSNPSIAKDTTDPGIAVTEGICIKPRQ